MWTCVIGRIFYYYIDDMNIEWENLSMFTDKKELIICLYVNMCISFTHGVCTDASSHILVYDLLSLKVHIYCNINKERLFQWRTIPSVKTFKAGDTNQKTKKHCNYFADYITELKFTCIKGINNLARKGHCRKHLVFFLFQTSQTLPVYGENVPVLYKRIWKITRKKTCEGS